MSRGRLALLLLVLLGVVGLASGAWWLVIRPKIQVAPTAQAPRAFRGEPEKVAERIDELANPFLSAPCFVSSENTCQLVFVHPREYGQERIEIRPYVLSGRQSAATNFFLYSRMLLAQGATQRFHIDPSAPQLNLYLEFVRSIPQPALTANLSPAYLYAVYERFFQALAEGGVPERSLGEEILPTTLAPAIQNAKNVISSAERNPLADSVRAQDWSPEAKALVYALAQSFDPDLVVVMLREEGIIERLYFELFTPETAQTIAGLTFDTAQADQANLTSEPENVLNPFFTAICRNGRAHACSVEGDKLRCSPLSVFDQDCANSLLNL